MWVLFLREMILRLLGFCFHFVYQLIKVFIKVKWANLSQNLFGIQKLKPIRGSIVRTAKKRFFEKI